MVATLLYSHCLQIFPVFCILSRFACSAYLNALRSLKFHSFFRTLVPGFVLVPPFFSESSGDFEQSSTRPSFPPSYDLVPCHEGQVTLFQIWLIAEFAPPSDRFYAWLSLPHLIAIQALVKAFARPVEPFPRLPISSSLEGLAPVAFFSGFFLGILLIFPSVDSSVDYFKESLALIWVCEFSLRPFR